jgi:hypothetical protein
MTPWNDAAAEYLQAHDPKPSNVQAKLQQLRFQLHQIQFPLKTIQQENGRPILGIYSARNWTNKLRQDKCYSPLAENRLNQLQPKMMTFFCNFGTAISEISSEQAS